MIHAALILAMTVGVSDRSRINGYDNSIAVLSTTGDITLAVTSTGSDSDTRRPDTITTGDYSAYPFATIQAAVDATPGMICHDTEIDVGTGTFAGALVSKQGCAASPENYPWIRIYGTRAAATLASGSVSGTATSGGTSTLTLTGASWTVDDLQGRILYVTAGTGAGEYVIATNTTDTITIPAVATFDGTSVFQLEDLDTVVSAPRGGGYTGGAVFEIVRNGTDAILQDIKITYSDADANGVFVENATATAKRVVMAASSAYDGFKAYKNSTLFVANCGYTGTVTHAAYSSYGVTATMYYHGIMAEVTGNGLRAVYGGSVSTANSGGYWIRSSANGVLLDDCNKTSRVSLTAGHIENAQYGIHSTNCAATLDTTDIDDTTVETIHVEHSELIVDTSLTGTGNVWGFDFSQSGNLVHFSVTPTVTGSSGDTTFDGSTATTWAVAIDSNNDAHNTGVVRFNKAAVGATAAQSAFSNAALAVSNGATGLSSSAIVGIAAEAQSDGVEIANGIYCRGDPHGSAWGHGGYFTSIRDDPTDTGWAIGIRAESFLPHTGAPNVAGYFRAQHGTDNYALYLKYGDIFSEVPFDIDIPDDDTSSLSIDTDGLSCLLCFDTSNSAEKLKTGATLELGAALDANGQLISDSTGAVKHGTDGTPGSAGVGDDYFGGGVEVDGPINADGGIAVGSSYGVGVGSASFMGNGYLNTQILSVYASPYTYVQLRSAVDDGAHLVIGEDDGYANRRLVIVDEANATANHGNNTLAADPTINQCSSADPTSDNTQCNEVTWNRLALGGRDGGYGCINQTFAYDDLVDGGGASGTLDLDEGIPDGAVVQQAVLHSLTGFTGDTSAVITIGDGTDVDRYNTGTPSVFTTNASGVALGVPSGTSWHDDAATVTVTVTSNADYTSVSAGQATILVCYWTP